MLYWGRKSPRIPFGGDKPSERLQRNYSKQLLVSRLQLQLSTNSTHIAVFHESLSSAIHDLNLATSAGRSLFNVDFTGMAGVEVSVFGVFAGQPLSAMCSSMEQSTPLVRRLRHPLTTWFLARSHEFVRGLSGDHFDRASENEIPKCQPRSWLEKNGGMAHNSVDHFYSLVTYTILGRMEAAISESLHGCEQYLIGASSTFFAALAGFYACLAMLSVPRALTDEEQMLFDRYKRMVQLHATSFPIVWQHKVLLLNVQACRNREANFVVLELYEDAILAASHAKIIQDEALALEMCGLWIYSLSPKKALPYLARACGLYRTWGAVKEVDQMKEAFPELLSPSNALLVYGSWQQSSEIVRPPSVSSTETPARLEDVSRPNLPYHYYSFQDGIEAKRPMPHRQSSSSNLADLVPANLRSGIDYKALIAATNPNHREPGRPRCNYWPR